MRNTQVAELVFVPAPGFLSHFVPAIELAKLITQRNQHISILILILDNPTSSHKTKAFVESKSADTPSHDRLTFLALPPLSPPPDPSARSDLIVELNKPLIKQAIDNRIQAGLSNLSGFVLDPFCTHLIDIVHDYFKVPSYILFTSGVKFLNILLYCQSLAHDDGVDLPTRFKDRDAEYDIPGFEYPVSRKIFPEILVDKEDDDGRSWILNHTKGFRRSKGILINTFEELETFGLHYLLDQAAKGSIPTVYPVGPVLELNNKIKENEHESSKILQWLDDKPLSSVVFICFGSIMGSFGAGQIKELAIGLERSGYPFLWTLPKKVSSVEGEEKHEDDDPYGDLLPEGFLDRTRERGKIIGWAPQVAILAHPAVGGFVSHCGWSSTLESLWFGVPVATWPLFADHQLVASMLVKELGVAVEIRMDYQHDFRTKKGKHFSVTADEVENGVKNLMNMDEETKKKIRGIGDKGKKSLEDGGFSHKWLGRFIEDVFNNVLTDII